MSESTESGGLLDKPTRQWPAWATALVALVVLLAQALVVVSAKGSSEAADAMRLNLQKLEGAVKENSSELKQVRLALESGKVAEQRLLEVEKRTEDHEARIRVLEARGR